MLIGYRTSGQCTKLSCLLLKEASNLIRNDKKAVVPRRGPEVQLMNDQTEVFLNSALLEGAGLRVPSK